MSRRFVHTLSYPEHIWLDFYRSFFSQKSLVVDDDGQPISNNFYIDQATTPENRRFDVVMEHDLEKNNPNILPCLVIEDLGLSTLGIALNRLSDWEVTPQTVKERSDLIRCTYVMHCCSRDRGESRLLASIVSNAMTVFYDSLLRAGLHKIEPWSVGKTTPIKSDSDETYVDTPVQATFEYQQNWRTIEDGPGDVRRFCLVLAPDTQVDYVRTQIDISDPYVARYVAMSMNLQDPNANIYVNLSVDLIDPSRSEDYVLTSTDVVDPLTDTGYVRSSMRVA